MDMDKAILTNQKGSFSSTTQLQDFLHIFNLSVHFSSYLILTPCFQSMASLQSTPIVHPALFLSSSKAKMQDCSYFPSSRRCNVNLIRAAQSSEGSGSSPQEAISRRQTLATGISLCGISLFVATPTFAAETKKGFTAVADRKDGYSFLYPFGWQEIVIPGQDKVFKDVIEPLESVSVNMIKTTKEDLHELGSPQEVAETLIKKVLAPPTQKTKLIEAKENEVDGKVYYTFEFVAQAPNFTRHALGAVSIGNGKFYTLTTGANERRWEKMKDRLHTVVDSFKVFKSDASAPPPA